MEELDYCSFYLSTTFFQVVYIFFMLIFVLHGCCLVQHFFVVIIQNYAIFCTMFNTKIFASFGAKYCGKVVPI